MAALESTEFPITGGVKRSVDICFSYTVERFNSVMPEVAPNPGSLLFTTGYSIWDSVAPNSPQFSSEKSAILFARSMRGGYLMG